MIVLLTMVLLSLLAAFFAQQNTNPVSIQIGGYVFDGIPLYIVILGSVLIGVFMSWIISLVNSLTSVIFLHKQENIMQELRKSVGELIRRVHTLEVIQNNHHKKEEKEETDENSL